MENLTWTVYVIISTITVVIYYFVYKLIPRWHSYIEELNKWSIEHEAKISDHSHLNREPQAPP